MEILSVGRDVTDRRRAEVALAGRNAMEEVLRAAATELLNVPVARLAEALERLLERLAGFVGCQRCLCLSLGELTWDTFCEWSIDAAPPVRGPFQNGIPWVEERLLRGEVAEFLDYEELPPEAEPFRELFARFGMRSATCYPLRIQGTTRALLSFEWVEARARPPSPETRELFESVVAIVASSLERKEREEAYGRAIADLERSQRLARVGTYSCEISSGAVQVSPVFRELFGLSGALAPQEVLPAVIGAVHSEDRERFRRLVESLCQGDVAAPTFEAAYRVVTPSGEVRHLLDRGGLVRDAEGRPDLILGAVFDNSERARDARERRSLEAQLNQAQRLESLGLLAGGVAHDFNNLLTALYGHLALARGEGGSEDPDRLGAMEEIADRASGLIQQLLAFSRQSPTEPEPVQLNELVPRALQVLERLLPKSVMVEFYPEPGLPEVQIVPVELEQLVLNLAINARDAMPQGGSLVLQTSLGGPVYAVSSPRVVTLRVQDSGSGMSSEVLERLFDPFFTTKPPEEGTGLGLAVAYGIMQRAGGAIAVESALGRGTSFSLHFPCGSAAAPGASEEGDPADSRETILVVDDDRAICDLAGVILERAGYRVLTSHCGEDALALCERRQVDLILLDHFMPGISGREVYEALAPRRPRLRFLFSSGSPTGVLPRDYVCDERRALLPKPYSGSELRAAVSSLLGKAGPSEPVPA